MAYEKLLNEIYAAISLKYLWPEYKPFFVKSESPDWVNENMSLGLEVSQALRPEDGQEEDFIERFLGCKKEELPSEVLRRYENRLHFYNGRFWAILPEDGCEGDYLEKAKYRFDRKLDKLNTNYERKKLNGLYLYLHPTDKETVDPHDLFDYMKETQKEKQTGFDLVFLNCESEIFVCDFNSASISTISIPKNAQVFLNREAESLRQTLDWNEGISI